jgi:hypothetical protein
MVGLNSKKVRENQLRKTKAAKISRQRPRLLEKACGTRMALK